MGIIFGCTWKEWGTLWKSFFLLTSKMLSVLELFCSVKKEEDE